MPAGRADGIAEAWGEWIGGMGEWHLFGGLTYDPKRRRPDGRGSFIPPGGDVVKRHITGWLAEGGEVIGRPIEAAVVAIEHHKSGWPHAHPLLRIAGGLVGDEIRQLGGLWFRDYGGNRLEVPVSRDDVCQYAAKYLSKDLDRGDVIFWPLRGSLSSGASYTRPFRTKPPVRVPRL